MDLKGSTFIVTGGASGLGAASARMIVAGGGHVVLADINAEVGNALAAELGRAARFVRTDVTDEASGKAAVAATTTGTSGRGVLGISTATSGAGYGVEGRSASIAGSLTTAFWPAPSATRSTTSTDCSSSTGSPR